MDVKPSSLPEAAKGRAVSFALGFIFGYKGSPWYTHLAYLAITVAAFFFGKRFK